jgi:Spy/CpxP family protein refolding chaperone
MKKTLLGLLVLAVAVPVLAQADDPETPRAKQAVIRFLQLTEDQVAGWDALVEAREAKVAPLREQLKATEEDLRELLAGDNPDPAAVGALVIKGKELKEQIGAAHKEYVDGFEAMLTPEQGNRLTALRRAAHLEPLFPAFRLYGLLAPR